MRDTAIVLAMIAALVFVAFKAGERVAETRCTYRATLARQTIEDAVSRASDALSDTVQGLTSADAAVDAKIKEIEDAKPAAARCTVPADRLRRLDQIGG